MNGGHVGTGVLLLVAVVGATAVRLLGPQALTVVRSPAPARVEDALTAAALVVATALAAWYLTTALLGLLAGLLRVSHRALERRGVARTRAALVVRASAATLEGMVRRFGAPALRRGLAIGVGLGLAVGSGPALAATLDEVPLDLRPGASSDESTHDAGTATAPPTSGSTDTGTAPSDGSTDSPVRAPAEAPSGAQPWQTPAPPSPAVGPTPATPSPAPSRPAAATPAPAPAPAPAAPSSQRPSPWAAPTTTPHTPPAVHTSESPAPPSTDERPEDAVRHTVVPGESLWRIAADRLGPGASDAAIALEWPRWYAANAAAIGPDPNLIRPGQELLAPPKEAGP